jgi:hypothetical protein
LVCADPAAFASVRGMPQCMAMGEAVGVAATIAQAKNLPVQAIDPVEVVAALSARGVRGIGGQALSDHPLALQS